MQKLLKGDCPMKNKIILTALSCLLLSGTCTLQADANQGTFDVQVDKTKTDAPLHDSTLPKPDTMTPDASKKEGFVSDHDLTKEIYKAIQDDRTISSDSKIKIQVSVYNGKVTLSGDVINQAEKERAELLANQVNKLKGVTNNIKVVK